MYHHPQGTLPLQGDRPFIVDEGGMGVTMYIPVTHFQRPDFAQTMQQQQQQQQQQQHPHQHQHHHRSGMATIACQTNHYGERTDRSVDPDKIDPKEAQMHLAKFQRSQSMRVPKSRDPRSSRISDKVSDSNFSRSTSLRYEEEKAQQVVKDINLKTSEVHQEKDKGKKLPLTIIWGVSHSAPKYPKDQTNILLFILLGVILKICSIECNRIQLDNLLFKYISWRIWT